MIDEKIKELDKIEKEVEEIKAKKKINLKVPWMPTADFIRSIAPKFRRKRR